MPTQKRVFIVHGWDAYPEEGWFPWLKKELEARGFNVFIPQLPKPEEPRIKSWVSKLEEVVEIPDEQTYFVGHSIGCQAIARYLEPLPKNVMIGGAVFVAGFFKRLTNAIFAAGFFKRLLNTEDKKEDEDEDIIMRRVSKEWLTTPLDFTKVKSHLKKSIAIFSDDDPYVPADNQDDFKNSLGSKIVLEYEQGHFSGSTGTTELPIALEAILEIAGEK